MSANVKSFRTPAGETLQMQQIDMSRQFARRVEAVDEIYRMGGEPEEVFRPEDLANELQGLVARKILMGIDVFDAKEQLRGMIMYAAPHKEEKVGGIVSIWCDPSYRKQGVSRRMMGRATSHLRSLGAEIVAGEIGVGNDLAQNFVLNHGWSFTGDIKEHHGKDFLVCFRPLRKQAGMVKQNDNI